MTPVRVRRRRLLRRPVRGFQRGWSAMRSREDAEESAAWMEDGREEGQGVIVADGGAARCIPPRMSSRAAAPASLLLDAGEE